MSTVIECIRDTTGIDQSVPETTITVLRGNDRSLTFRTRDRFGPRVTITGATISFPVKPAVGGTQLFQRTVGSGLTISTQSGNTAGEFVGTIITTNTSTASPGDYVW